MIVRWRNSEGRLRNVQPALVWNRRLGGVSSGRGPPECTALAFGYLLSAPPANGWCAVFAPEMTVSIVGNFFSARSIDSFVAR